VDRRRVGGAGLYIHVPFCRSICPYCDFAVLIAGEPRRQAWEAGLVDEMGLHRDGGWVFDTLYLGGGTPSLLQPAVLGRILTAVRDAFELEDGTAIFLEANPEDVTGTAVRVWRELGVHTISLGVQSPTDAVLSALGRRHDAAGAMAAARRLIEAGFGSVSLDLIYGFDGHSEAQWRRELAQVLALRPDHLSCYQLTIHPGTVLGRRLDRGEIGELDGDRQGELFRLTHRVLADAGYEGYEVSNFAAAPRHRSRHNVKYWSHVPYLGLGPSAHSFRDSRRWWNHRKLRKWQNELSRGEAPMAGEEQLTAGDLALEALVLGLRTRDGVDLERIRTSWGVDIPGVNGPLIARSEEAGYLWRRDGRLVPTLDGMAVADGLAASFAIPESR
jgi:oxygen-independent coproporphyrinogen-3 oxidase